MLGLALQPIAFAAELPPEVAEVLRLMEQSPQDVDAHLSRLWDLSLAYEEKGDLQSAIAAMDELINHAQGRFVPHMMRMGWLHGKAGDFQAALRSYRLAHDIKPSVEAEHGMLGALIELQRWPEADQTARAVLERDPDNYLAILRLGYVAYRQGDYDRSIASYDRALSLAPEDPDALAGKGYALLAKGERDRARVLFQDVLGKNPDHALAKGGVEAARDFKFGLSQYYTQIFYSPQAIRTQGREFSLTPSINYRDRLIFTPNFTYDEIAFGQFSTAFQNTVNLGLWASLAPQYALNLHVAQVYNNQRAPTSANNGKIVFAEAQYSGKVFVGAGGAYSDYNADTNLGVAQATLRVGYTLTPGLWMQTKGWYTGTRGPLAPTGAGYQRDTVAIEQRVAVTLPRVPAVTLGGTVWFGRKQFPIEGDGAQIWNLADLLMGGYSADFSYVLASGANVYFSGGILRARPADDGVPYQQYMLTFGFSTPLRF